MGNVDEVCRVLALSFGRDFIHWRRCGESWPSAWPGRRLLFLMAAVAAEVRGRGAALELASSWLGAAAACSRQILARAREGRGGVMMALAARARRWCATARRFQQLRCGGLWHRSLCGARGRGERWPARSSCGVRDLRQPPVRRSVRQRAAARRRPTSMVCWWRSDDAGGAADQRRAPATTGHRAAACDQHDTRRHTATSLMLLLLLGRRLCGAVQLRGHRQHAALKDQQFRGPRPPARAESSRARARGAAV